MDTYCWIHSTFSIPSRVKGVEGLDIAHAGVAPNSDLEDGQTVNTYEHYYLSSQSCNNRCSLTDVKLQLKINSCSERYFCTV